ncbi:hypothetical protein ACFLYR_06970 [Chloroflexota bacterium]
MNHGRIKPIAALAPPAPSKREEQTPVPPEIPTYYISADYLTVRVF